MFLQLKAKSQEITAKRKEMVAGDYKNKHFVILRPLTLPSFQ